MDAERDRGPVDPSRARVIRPCPDGQSEVACLACGHLLDIHQPDPSHPLRMLGTCDECGRWHLIDCRPADDSAAVILLPEPFDPDDG